MALNNFTELVLDSNDDVLGEIYLITNKVNNKQYVGQTHTHRLNHGKWRPFGYLQRFKDHLSESRTDVNKKNALKAAIRKYGEANFATQLVERCSKEDLDEREMHFIQQYNTLYPDGYNLTIGGKSMYVAVAKTPDGNYDFLPQAKRRTEQTLETRQKISVALKRCLAKDDEKQSLISRAQEQHLKSKTEKFKDVKVDLSKIDDYLSSKMMKGHRRYCVKIEGLQTSFCSYHESDEVVKTRAIDFIKSLKN